jgi:hypothetical protein
MFISLEPRKLRYGLKIKGQINLGLRLLLAFFAALFFSAGASEAQEATWWGSPRWFDWSDFRASANARLFFARLQSAKITQGGAEFDLKAFPYSLSNPEVIREALFELYIDRLGLRWHMQDHAFHTFQGALESVNELRGGGSRFGVDLDVIRYPFFRMGADFDYTLAEPTFSSAFVLLNGVPTLIGVPNPTPPPAIIATPVEYRSVNPMTIGVHATAIPGRIREIPIIVNARARFPIPFLKQNPDAKVTDWEVSAGLRPSIWQTSLYAHTTFAVDLEGGFRSVDLNFDATPDAAGSTIKSISIKARWQGAFVQVGLAF